MKPKSFAVALEYVTVLTLVLRTKLFSCSFGPYTRYDSQPLKQSCNYMPV